MEERGKQVVGIRQHTHPDEHVSDVDNCQFQACNVVVPHCISTILELKELNQE